MRRFLVTAGFNRQRSKLKGVLCSTPGDSVNGEEFLGGVLTPNRLAEDLTDLGGV